MRNPFLANHHRIDLPEQQCDPFGMRKILLSLAFVCAATLYAQAPGRLYVVTYVDVYPNFADGTADALRQFVAASKKDPGFVRFEFMRDVSRTNHFAIVEVWQSRQMYEGHLTQPHVKAFREKIQPWMGSPFDERLYNVVE
jgi:quinol monooxygenase YgiN